VAEPTPDVPDVPDEVVLGVDYGTVRIGLALGFLRTGLTIGVPVLDNPGSEDAVVAALAEVARARSANVVVLGKPLHLSGKESAGSRLAARLRDKLEQLLGAEAKVVLEDERLTSADAAEQLRDAGLRWWQMPKSQIDTVSAMTIARTYMTRRNPALLMDREEDAPAPPPRDDPGNDRRNRRKKAQRRGTRRDEDES
jgi:putative transcription antitermination factor YqgF